MSLFFWDFSRIRFSNATGETLVRRQRLRFQGLNAEDTGEEIVLTNTPLTGLQVTELATTPGLVDGEVRYCNGYRTAGDGGHGEFYWTMGTPAQAKDGYLRIDATGGQWQRIYDASLNVRWFGARGDGTPGDAPAFQRCVDTAASLSKQVFVPCGTYDFGTTTVTVNVDVEIEGSGIYKTTVRGSGGGTQALFEVIVPYPVPSPGTFVSRHFRMRNLSLQDGGYGLKVTGQIGPSYGVEAVAYMTNFSGLENVEFRGQTRSCFHTIDVSWLMCSFTNLDFAPSGAASPATYGVYAKGYIPFQCAIFKACGFHYASGALFYGEDPFPPPAGTNQHTQLLNCTFQAADGYAVQLKSFGAHFTDCYWEQNGKAAPAKPDVVLTTNYAGVAGRSPMDVFFLRPMFAQPSPAQAVSGTYPRIKTVHPGGYGSSLLNCKVEDATMVNGYDHTWDIARDYSNGYMLVNSPGLRLVNTYATSVKRFTQGVVNPGRMVITDPTPQPVGYVDDSEYGSAELVLCTGSVGGTANRWALYVINLPFDVAHPLGFSATLVAGTAGWVTFDVSGNRWRATTLDGSHVSLTRFSGAVTG